MDELPLWAERLVPWIFVALGVAISWYLLILTPPAIFLVPSYGASIVAWMVIGRLFLPTQRSTKGRITSRPPIISWGLLSLLLLATGFLTRIRADIFLPVAAGFVGFFIAISTLLAYEILWKSKLLYCEKCLTYQTFVRNGSDLYCRRCGKRRAERIVAEDPARTDSGGRQN